MRFGAECKKNVFGHGWRPVQEENLKDKCVPERICAFCGEHQQLTAQEVLSWEWTSYNKKE